MRVLIYEDNLMWGPRLRMSLEALGHEAKLVEADLPLEADLAIVNLGSKFNLDRLVPDLRKLGVRVVAHAGHKEQELLSRGRELGCDAVVTNGALTYKLPAVLAQVMQSAQTEEEKS